MRRGARFRSLAARALAALTLALGAGWALACGGAWAAQIQIESPSFTFDAESNLYRYQGARVEVGGVTVEADLVEIDADAAKIVASGRVRYQERTVTGSAERLELLTETGVATLHHAELYDAETGYFLRGETLVRTGPATYEGRNCWITNCRPGEASWSISAGSMDYELDSYSLAYNSALWLGSVPVLWTPVLGWPTVEGRRSGLLAPSVSGTYSTKSRFDLGNSVTVPYFLALGHDQDLTLTPEYFAKRGTALNLEYDYALVENQRGELKLFGIQETQHRGLSGENVLEGVDVREEDRTPARYWARFGHNQAFTERAQLVGRLAEASDGQVLREYEALREYRPALDYQATLSYQSYWGNGAATADHTSEYIYESLFADSDAFTDGDTRPQLLPRVTYNGGWQPGLATPFGLGLSGSVTRFVTEAGVSGRADTATPALSYPVPLFGSAELRPTIERRFVRYGDLGVADPVLLQPPPGRQPWLRDAEALGSEESFAQTALELELRAPLARRFDQAEGRWQALKHRVTPRLIFSELEDVPQALPYLLVAPEPALRLVTVRLDNELLGLPRGSGSPLGASIAGLNLIQRYNLLLVEEDYQPAGPALPTPGETEPGEPLLPLIVEGTLTAGGGVGIASMLRYHHQRGRIVEYRIGLEGTVSEQGRFGIGYSENQFTYRTPQNRLVSASNSFGMSGEILSSDTLSFLFDGTVNLADSPAPLNRRFSRAQVTVDYHPNCYGIQVAYIEQVDVTREYNPATGEDEDSFFINRRIVVTFNLGGVITSSRGFALSTD